MRTPTRLRTTISTQKRRSAATQIAFHQLVKRDPRVLVGLLTLGKKRQPSRLGTSQWQTNEGRFKQPITAARTVSDWGTKPGTEFPVTCPIQDATGQAPTLYRTARHCSRWKNDCQYPLHDKIP